MATLPGIRLGPDEILAPLGARGLGEICRGRDTQFDRAVTVTIKVRLR